MRTSRTVKNGTQEQKKLCDEFDEAYRKGQYHLGTVYKSWSKEKEDAMNECRRFARDCDGYALVITKHNGWKFNAAFLTEKTAKPGQLLVTITKDCFIICDYIGEHEGVY